MRASVEAKFPAPKEEIKFALSDADKVVRYYSKAEKESLDQTFGSYFN